MGDVNTAADAPATAPPAGNDAPAAVARPAGRRPPLTRPRLHRLSEFQNFDLAVIGDPDTLKMLSAEQFDGLSAKLDLLKQLLIPGYELAKLELEKFIKENWGAKDRSKDEERSRLGILIASKIEGL